MIKIKALEKLNTLLIELQELPPYVYDSENKEFKKWERKAWRYIENIFKDSDRGQMSELLNIQFEYVSHNVYIDDPSSNDYIETHNEGRKQAITLIESFIEEVDEWEDAVIASENADIQTIQLIIKEAKEFKSYKFKRYEPNPEFDKWMRRAKRSIDKICTSSSEASIGFSKINFKYNGPRGMSGLEVPLDIQTFNNGLIESISLLESIIEEIEDGMYDTNTQEVNSIVTSQETDKTKVFIVHGHDDAAKQEVARFIEKFGLEAIILHEKPSSSKTIIEKIEAYTSDVGFGIVLYTECDIGGKDNDNLKARARQNVVFEHGYLIGRLGRENVCSLVKGNVETPGDIDGVVYESMNGISWHLPLVKELEASGYVIDRNLL